MLDLRLVAYAPNGDRIGLLPHPLSVEVGWPLNDVPSLRLSYSRHAPGAEHLDSPVEVAVEWSDGGEWVEAPDSRFLAIKRSGSETTDDTKTVTFDMPGWAWQLRKLVLYPTSTMVEGKRQFSAVTPGAILRTFYNEGRDRGALPGLSVDFDTSRDSAGQPWAATLTLGIEPGRDLLAMLLNLAEQGVIDWCMQGRTLRVFNEGTVRARNLATGPAPVDLRLGRDITEAPDQGTWEQAASHILVAGEAGLSVEVSAPVNLPWGRWEAYQAQGGVRDAGTAALLGQYALQRASGERVQITRGITPISARWLPLRDYQPGDTILAPGDRGQMEPLRVRQITLTKDANGVAAGNLTLNDRFLEDDIRIARRAQGILDGGIAVGGNGNTPAPETEGRVPAAPEGLIVQADAYIAPDGYARGQITATWSPVTADVNGVALDVDGYELYGRRLDTGQEWGLLTKADVGQTTVTYSPLQTRTEYEFKVRAVADGTPGEFSQPVRAYIPDDVVPPPAPSKPELATRLGVIQVTWDGLAHDGAPMPADFDHVVVYMSGDDGLTWEPVGTLRAAGTFVVTDQPYNEERLFRLTAVDRSGNESVPSQQASIATKPLVDTDLIGQVISGANIVDGTINAADKVIANSITGDLIQANAIQAGHIAANAITADKIQAGAVNALALAADAIDGKTITGAFIRTAATGQRLELAPPGATLPELRFYPTNGANYTVLRSRSDRFSGEATLTITTSQDAASSYRAHLEMSATLTSIKVMDPATTVSKGGVLEIARDYAYYGFNAGSTNTECAIRFDSSGRWNVRGRYWDFENTNAYDAVIAGSWSVGGASSPNWVIFYYGPTMATNMGPVVSLRDGASGGPNAFENNMVPAAWAISASNTTGFQVNLARETSFAVYFWCHRH